MPTLSTAATPARVTRRVPRFTGHQVWLQQTEWPLVGQDILLPLKIVLKPQHIGTGGGRGRVSLKTRTHRRLGSGQRSGCIQRKRAEGVGVVAAG